jgi:hypothetical protein
MVPKWPLTASQFGHLRARGCIDLRSLRWVLTRVGQIDRRAKAFPMRVFNRPKLELAR